MSTSVSKEMTTRSSQQNFAQNFPPELKVLTSSSFQACWPQIEELNMAIWQTWVAKTSVGFTKIWFSFKIIQLEPLKLDIGIVVLVDPLVILPLLAVLEHLLLKVMFEPAVPKDEQCLSVEDGHHQVVCPVHVIKAILELLKQSSCLTPSR